MNTKVSSILKKVTALAAVFLFSLITVVNSHVHAEQLYTVDDINDIIGGILAYKTVGSGAENAQDWLDGELSDNAGISSEWYVIGLSRYDSELDTRKYAEALKRYIAENKTPSASTRLKYALTLAAVGEDGSALVPDSVGKQGIMSYVFALHLANNGVVCEQFGTEALIKTILSLQLMSGGFAVTGDNGDADVTAMTIQALAPHYGNNDEATIAVDAALTFLSSKQLDNGCFMSYGVENAESSAQVLTALTSLGIDPLIDERFVKPAGNVVSALLTFRLDNGAFSHKHGEDVNESATQQAFYSLVSYCLYLNGSSPLYVFDQADSHGDEDEANVRETEMPTMTEISSNEVDITDTDNANLSSESKTDENASDENDDKKVTDTFKPTYKAYVSGAIILAAVVVLIVLTVKKKNIKNHIAVIVLTALAVFAVTEINIVSTEEYYGSNVKNAGNAGSVKMSIRCDVLRDKADSEKIPVDCVILAETEYGINDGDTVYDVLIEAVRKNSIQLDKQGSDDMVYVSSIANIYELEYGSLSGWMYKVNGEAPSVGCGAYKLKSGDTIEWQYTCELGKDLEN